MHPSSPRLIYRPLGPTDVEPFHRLATDPHVRRYLLDGDLVTTAWCRNEIRISEALFRDRGVGLWLLHRQPTGPAIGFGGFKVFASLGPEPQLLYAFTEAASGHGFATECARALVAHALAQGFGQVTAAVDAPNVASVRVLEKAGFRREAPVDGPSGPTLRFSHPGATAG